MDVNRTHDLVKSCDELSGSYSRFIPGYGIGAIGGCHAGFYEMVKSGAEWDFKSNQRIWRHNSNKYCPSSECDKTVTLCGHCLNYDVPGNIHFGYIGRMMGIRTTSLHLGADWAQKGGTDDPKDTVAINIGIKMADQGAALCPEIAKKLGQLNRDKTLGCSPCSWGPFSMKNKIQ